jgi:protein tyrosine/serine phosphatase
MENISFTFKNGSSLTMCDLEDFRDTLEPKHTVVTLCRYPPRFIDSDKQERHHYYFRAHNDDPNIWQHASELVLGLLDEGKDVLLHCVHGRDRTGGVGYIVLRILISEMGLHPNCFDLHAKSSDTDSVTDLMALLRPKIGDIFKEKVSSKLTLYENVFNTIYERRLQYKKEGR